MSWYRIGVPGWAGSALWELRPSPHGDVARARYWPTSIIKGSTARKGLHRHDRRQRVLPGKRNRPRRQGSDKLKVAYLVFKDEACDVSPKYAPKTVSTDGSEGTQAAWKMLFYEGRHPAVLLARLARDPRPGQTPLKRCLPKSPGGFGRPITPPTAGVLHDACGLAPPVGGRTPHRDRPGEGLGPVWQSATAGRLPTATPAATARSSMLSTRLMRGMNRDFDQGQHLHGSLEALPIALSCLGLRRAQLHALASGGGAGKPRLAVPRRTT